MTNRPSAFAGTLALMSALAACNPTAPTLRGTVAPARLPSFELPRVHRKIVFRWVFADANYTFRGEGAARVAPPDSVRLDFFVDGGLGGGSAVMIGDSVRVPGEMVAGLLPPPPLLWAAFGRLRVPALPDTTVRIDGDTTRADIGKDPRWRVTYVNGALVSLLYIESGRISQSLVRDAAGRTRYQHIRSRRILELTTTRVDTVPSFDAATWP